MAMTQLALMFMGALATLGTIGLFLNFQDDMTRGLVGFAGSVVWFLFGISSFDVIVVDSYAATKSEPIMPLVFVGFGFGAVVALFSLKAIFDGIGDEASTVESELMQ
jgi:hypothetical protein